MRCSVSDGGTRRRFVAPSRLPEAETAYTLTVHKSQGSEFEHIALLLPAFEAMLGRELLYTAITRARRRFSLLGSVASMEQAVAPRTLRHSGRAAKLPSAAMKPHRRAMRPAADDRP